VRVGKSENAAEAADVGNHEATISSLYLAWAKGAGVHLLEVVLRVILVVVLLPLAAMVYYVLIYRNLNRDADSDTDRRNPTFPF
jgi:hypothetical protein